ncbi:hypothetical protein [Deinococcus sp. YIM 77859]|nr:hypothetical protein [Deinococcus sp. YIM 77859]
MVESATPPPAHVLWDAASYAAHWEGALPREVAEALGNPRQAAPS